MAGLLQERAAIQQQLARDTARIAVAQVEQRRRETQAAAEAGAGSASSSPVALKAAAALDVIVKTPWRDLVLAQNPELQARYLAIRRADLTAMYGPFLVANHLSTEQAQRFTDIMAAADERSLDLRSAITANGWDDADPAAATLRAQSDERTRAEQRGLLGDDGYKQLLDYQRQQPARDVIGGLAVSLTFTGEPLSATQAEQLTRILSEGNAAYRAGGQASTAIPNISDSILSHQPAHEPLDTDQVLSRASEILSPAQYTPFEAEILRGRTITTLFNVVLQAPGDPISGFTILPRK